MTKLDPFTRAYIEAMLWEASGGPNGDTPLDRNYSVEDFDPRSLKRIIADCAAFQEECSDWYDDARSAGHDFWLTRVGAGAGFWDGDYPEPQATLLTNASKRFGHVDVVEDEYDVGPLHLEPSIADARKHALRLDPEAFKKPPAVNHATRTSRGSHVTKKTPAQLQREIDEALASKRGRGVLGGHATRKKRVAESQEMKGLREAKERLFSALGYAGNTSDQVREYHRRIAEIDAKMKALAK